MRKFLIVLMVVAMASFLFVGCVPGVTPDVDEDEDVPAPASTPPTILDIQKSDGVTSIVDVTATGTEYINKTEAGSSILVVGIAGPEALVKVYIGSATIPVAVGAAAKTGLFSVAVAETALGADSLVAKTLYATSTEVALAESVASNVATFILDTDLPGIDSVAFTADEDEEDGTAELTADGTAIDNVTNVADTTLIETGTWKIDVLSDVSGFNTVKITGPGFEETYGEGNLDGAVFAANSPIPGVEFTLETPLAVGQHSEIVCTAEGDAIAGRATLKFDEDVSYAAATATTCVYGGVADGDDPSVYKEAINTGYWTGLTINEGTPYKITVYGVKDSAGNVGGTKAVPLTKSAIAGAASETDLEP